MQLHSVLNMPRHGSICLNKTLICLNMSKFSVIDRVLNMTGFWISFIQYIAWGQSRSYEYLFRDERIQNPVKDQKWSALEKQLKLLTISTKYSILNLWEGSEYVSGLKYVRILIIPDCQYARVLNFQGYTGFKYFRKYDRVLSWRRNAIM